MSVEEQNKVIFEPVSLPSEYVFKLPDQTKEVFIEVAQDIRLNGLWHHQTTSDKLVIYFPGNSKNLQNFLDNHSMALSWGYDLLVTDYRGFGKSGGNLDGQTQMYADAERVYDYALSLGYKPEQLILYGYSMGTALASHLATIRHARALILESPYSSLAEISWVGAQAPAYGLNNKEQAKTIKIPTLIVHGDTDHVIPADHAQRIYDNLPTKNKKLVIIKGGGHGDLSSRVEYKQIIQDFLGGTEATTQGL